MSEQKSEMNRLRLVTIRRLIKDKITLLEDLNNEGSKNVANKREELEFVVGDSSWSDYLMENTKLSMQETKLETKQETVNELKWVLRLLTTGTPKKET